MIEIYHISIFIGRYMNKVKYYFKIGQKVITKLLQKQEASTTFYFKVRQTFFRSMARAFVPKMG